jgi:hypothetical protein
MLAAGPRFSATAEEERRRTVPMGPIGREEFDVAPSREVNVGPAILLSIAPCRVARDPRQRGTASDLEIDYVCDEELRCDIPPLFCPPWAVVNR